MSELKLRMKRHEAFKSFLCRLKLSKSTREWAVRYYICAGKFWR